MKLFTEILIAIAAAEAAIGPAIVSSICLECTGCIRNGVK